MDDLIARRVAGLGDRLVGPARRKADLLREVDDGLRDAAEAMGGDERAQRAAVDEFGDLDSIAGDFQVELAAGQTRRTLALLAVVGPVGEVASRIVWSNAEAPRVAVSPWAGRVSWLVDVLGWSTSIVAALGLLVVGIGARWLMPGARFVRVVGYGALAKVAFTAIGGVVLSWMFGEVTVVGGYRVFELLVGPCYLIVGCCVAWLGWRCLRMASRVDSLSARSVFVAPQRG